MKFGTALKNVVETGSGGSDYLRSFKEGETKIRFLNETDDFIMFREHFAEGKSFPCMQDSAKCPGCASDQETVRKASRKYACNVLFVETGYVNQVKMPVTLVNRLVTRSERNGGTITNRDYVVIKTGKGIDTEYDVEQEDKYPVDLTQYESSMKDINEMLKNSFEAVWGPVSQFESGNKKPQQDFPSKSASNSGHADYEEIDESTVRAMSINQLMDIANKANIDVSSAKTREEMSEILIMELS